MDTLFVILYVLAALCFLVAAFAGAMATTTTNAGATFATRVNLVALGLLFWVMVPMINLIDAMND